MTIPILTRQQVREVDRMAMQQYQVLGIVPDGERGRGCVDVLCQQGIEGRVVICCGRGNNAGDGLVMARHLELRGYTAELLFWSDPTELTGDAGANYQIAMSLGAGHPHIHFATLRDRIGSAF